MRYNAIGRGMFKKTDIYLLTTRVAMITVPSIEPYSLNDFL